MSSNIATCVAIITAARACARRVAVGLYSAFTSEFVQLSTALEMIVALRLVVFMALLSNIWTAYRGKCICMVSFIKKYIAMYLQLTTLIMAMHSYTI